MGLYMDESANTVAFTWLKKHTAFDSNFTYNCES